MQRSQPSSVRSAGQENYQGEEDNSPNLTITRTGKVYLRRRDDSLHLQVSDIPDYILKIHKQHVKDPTAFEAGKSRQHFRSCISLLHRYSLVQKKQSLNARKDPAQYMRNYRQRKKEDAAKLCELGGLASLKAEHCICVC